MQKIYINVCYACYQSCDIGPITFQADYGPFKRAAQLDLTGIKQFHKIFFFIFVVVKKAIELAGTSLFAKSTVQRNYFFIKIYHLAFQKSLKVLLEYNNGCID